MCIFTIGLGFYVNLPIGAIAVIAILLLRIPEQTAKQPARTILLRLHHYIDLLGFVLFAASVLQLLLALQYGGNVYPWNSSQVIGLFCGSAATAIVWLFWNRHKKENALLPHSMISRRAVWSSGIYQAFLMSAVYGATYYLPIYFQAINNASAILSGVYLLPTILPQLVMAASSGVLCEQRCHIESNSANYPSSNENRIRYPSCCIFNDTAIGSEWTILPTPAWQSHRLLGWVPNSCRHWLRGRFTSGTYL